MTGRLAAGTPLPGRTSAQHPSGTVAIAELVLTGDADRLAAWLDGAALPIAVRAGEPAVRRVVLHGPAGVIVL